MRRRGRGGARTSYGSLSEFKNSGALRFVVSAGTARQGCRWCTVQRRSREPSWREWLFWVPREALLLAQPYDHRRMDGVSDFSVSNCSTFKFGFRSRHAISGTVSAQLLVIRCNWSNFRNSTAREIPKHPSRVLCCVEHIVPAIGSRNGSRSLSKTRVECQFHVLIIHYEQHGVLVRREEGQCVLLGFHADESCS